MSHSHNATPNRRQFLKLSAQLAALGLTTAGVGNARTVFAADARSSQTLTDYKALVCIYLFGGNDGNNTIVPLDTTRRTQYETLRGGLALSAGKLLSPIADAAGNPWAMHYGLAELNPLYESGQLAFVMNMGLLQKPLTRTQYLAGQPAPTNLFSHSDQTVQAQTGMPTPNGSGWGGRLLDCFGTNDSLAAVSVSQPALFLQGFNAGGNVIPPGVDLRLSGMNFWPNSEAQWRRQQVDQMLTLDGGNPLRKAANKAMADGLQLADTLASSNAANTGNLSFPGTGIGNQLKEVAKLIKVRSAMGPGRQVFFCSLDGFDLHSSQDWTHWYLLSQLSQAMHAFHNAIGDAGLTQQVTTFTQSEFGRTLQPSGSGSDHAWGSNQIVLGGAVKGGIYGTLPTFALGGPDDANDRGVWIPTISTSQFGATLGKWFGASASDLAWAFPTLTEFPTSDIGFMHPVAP
jgi:uncharacterized protein (DUF1501 family)